jgi:hypothetical protein
VKFRFCLYCQIPVAKRNFRLRHNHLDSPQISPAEDMQVPSTINVASDSAGATRLSGYVPYSIAPSSIQPTEASDTQLNVTFNLPSADDMVAAAEDERDHRKRTKKPKHAKHELSSKKRERTSVITNDQSKDLEQNPFVPSTIQIGNSSPSSMEANGMPLESNDVKLASKETEDAKPDQAKPQDRKKSRKRSKRRSCPKNRKHSNQATKTDEKYAALPVEAPQPGTLQESPIVIEDAAISKKSSSKKAASNTKGEVVAKAAKRISAQRLVLWSGLLGQRPLKHDEDNMSKWLMSVLAVSNLAAPLKEEKELSSTPSSLSLESSDNNQGPSSSRHREKSAMPSATRPSPSSDLNLRSMPTSLQITLKNT